MRMEIPAEQLAKRKDWLTNLPTCWLTNGFALAVCVCVCVGVGDEDWESAIAVTAAWEPT